MQYVSTLPVIALLVATATPAAANGRPPSTFKVGFRPSGPLQPLSSDPIDMVVGTTFGFLISSDEGATWRWGCDSVVGIRATFDPDYELTSSGLLLATSNNGIYLSRDGCTWTKPSGALETGATSSIAVAPAVAPNGEIWVTRNEPPDPDDPTNPLAGYAVFKSVDDGQTFVKSSGTPTTDWWDTIEVAPSDPDRIYLTGFRFNGTDGTRTRILARSMNGGDTWEELPTTALMGAKYSVLQVAAISPSDPNLVYLRLTLSGMTQEETIYRTANGNAASPTWTEVLRKQDFLNGLTIRDNGDVYVVQSTEKILYRSRGGGGFEPVAGVAYAGQCLAERPTDHQLYMCMSDLVDGSDCRLAKSPSAEAGTWTAALRFPDIAGPILCQPGTLQHDDCEVNLWCGQKDQLHATTNEINCSAPDAGPPLPPPVDDGCCNSGGLPGLELGSLAVLLLRRRRRTAV